MATKKEAIIKTIQENGFIVDSVKRGVGVIIKEYTPVWMSEIISETYTVEDAFADLKAALNPQKEHYVHFGHSVYRDVETLSVNEVKDSIDLFSRAILYKEESLILKMSDYDMDCFADAERLVDDLMKGFGYLVLDENSLDIITFDQRDWSGDYKLVHGSIGLTPSEEEVVSSDGRVYGDPDIVEEWWDFNGLDCLKESLKVIDPEEKVTVYHRKGKDWYFSPTLESKDLYYYWVEEGGLCEEWSEENLACLTNNEVKSLVEKVKEVFDKEHEYLVEKADFIEEAKGVVSQLNEVITDGLYVSLQRYAFEEKYEKGKDVKAILSLALLDFMKDDVLDFGQKYTHFKKFKKYLKSKEIEVDGNRAVKGDKSVDYYLIDVFIDYKAAARNIQKALENLDKLEKLCKSSLKKLVFTTNGYSNKKEWAIKVLGEEYHFSNEELYQQEAKDLYRIASVGLKKRIVEKKNYKDIMEKAKKVFVSFDDSRNAGNCFSGTLSFCRSKGINIDKIGGIRGDVLLNIETNAFTLRAVTKACERLKVSCA